MSRYRETMTDLYRQVQENAGDYLRSKMTDTQINNIKKTWSMKTAKDVTPAIRDMIKKMDIPTQLAIKHAKINQLSKLVEDLEENFSTSQIARLKKEYEVLRGKKISVANANKLSQMFKNIPDSGLTDIFKADIPFLSVMAMTKMIQKGIPRPAGVKLNLEEVEILDEALHEIVDVTEGMIDGKKFDSLKKGDTMTISYKSAMGNNVTGKKFKVKSKSRSAKYNTDKVTLHPDGNPSMARFFLYKRADGSVSMATGDMAVSMTNFKEEIQKEEIDEGRMSEIDAMRKAGASAAEIAKELKLNVKDVKAILGEEADEEDEEEKEEPKKETKEDDKEKLKAELEKKEAEIEMLKTKAETEKAKVAKKETEKLVNPETGEPLLQVGIAYKHLKDKMAKEELEEERTYTVVHVKHGKEVIKANGTYDAAKKYAQMKGLKNTSGVDAHLMEMAKDKAYAIGMSTAKKKFNDEPPLEKKTIKKGHEIADKLMGMKKEATIKEYKKMTVTFNSMADMAKASTDLAKQGFTINAKGMVMKVDGKGADLNKYGTDLQNFYKAKVVAEETIVEFTSQQIKMAYGVANDKRYKGGNYSGAVRAIEKIAKGLSNHPDVMKVLQRTNENVNESPMMSMNKQSPEYKQGQQAAKQGKKYIDNPHSDAQKKLNWSGGHNAYRALNMAKEMYESLAALKKKADKSGMPYSILKKVFDRGMAAWKGGHRPGASQHQWAYARVNSFVTKSSGTWGGADKDLAAKVKGESLEEASLYAFKEYEPSQQYEAGRDMKNIEDAIKKAGGRIKSKEKPTRREPNLSFEIETGNPTAVKAAIKKADPEFNVD